MPSSTHNVQSGIIILCKRLEFNEHGKTNEIKMSPATKYLVSSQNAENYILFMLSSHEHGICSGHQI